MVTSDEQIEIIHAVKDRVAEVLGDLKDDRNELVEILDRAGVDVNDHSLSTVKGFIEKAIASVDGDSF